MSNPIKLVFDIETVGADFDSLDKTTKESLTRWIEKESANDDEYASALEDLKQGLGFSPLTGEIVAIGMLQVHTDEGAVYFQAPGEKIKEFTEEGIKFKQFDERGMLEAFWKVAEKSDVFISFNG